MSLELKVPISTPLRLSALRVASLDSGFVVPASSVSATV